MNYLVTETDIRNTLGNVNIVVYRDLHRVKSLFDLFKGKPYFVLLYEHAPNIGHWCLVINHGDRIEVFDSYGIKVDDELGFSTKEFREQTNMRPHLSKLLLDTGKKVEYNHFKLQGEKSATCGRYVIWRALLHFLTLEDFKKFLTDPDMTPDELIIFLDNIHR